MSHLNPSPSAVLATLRNVIAASSFDSLARIRCFRQKPNPNTIHAEQSALNTWSRILTTEMSADWWRDPQASMPNESSEQIGMAL